MQEITFLSMILIKFPKACFLAYFLSLYMYFLVFSQVFIKIETKWNNVVKSSNELETLDHSSELHVIIYSVIPALQTFVLFICLKTSDKIKKKIFPGKKIMRMLNTSIYEKYIESSLPTKPSSVFYFTVLDACV